MQQFWVSFRPNLLWRDHVCLQVDKTIIVPGHLVGKIIGKVTFWTTCFYWIRSHRNGSTVYWIHVRSSGSNHQKDGRRHGCTDQHGFCRAARRLMFGCKALFWFVSCWFVSGVAHKLLSLPVAPGGGKAVVITTADPAIRERAKARNAMPIRSLHDGRRVPVKTRFFQAHVQSWIKDQAWNRESFWTVL